MSIDYINKLEEKHIIESQRTSHEIWGAESSLESRIEKLQRILAFAGSSILSMSGLIDVDGNLLSSLKRYSIEIKFQDQLFKTIGLGAIFTSKIARGQGLAKILIEKVLAEEKDRGTALALLYSDIDPNYYKKFGFIDFPAYDISVSVESIPNLSSNLELRQATPSDLQKLIEICESSFSSDQLRFSTSHKQWTFFRNLEPSSMEYIVFKEGRDLGYFCLSKEKNNGEAFLKECIIPDKYLEEMFVLIKDFCHKEGIVVLKSWSNISYPKTILKKINVRKVEIPMLANLANDARIAQIPIEKFCFGPMNHF